MKTGSPPFGIGDEVLAVDAQGLRHARVERPCTQVVGLILVEPHHAVREVEPLPRERQWLPFPHPLSRQEAQSSR
jgi:hypothetical protein